MNSADVERELRLAAPEEAQYRPRQLVLDNAGPTRTERIGAHHLFSMRASAGLRAVGAGLLAVTLVVAAFAVGRLSAPFLSGPGAAPSTAAPVQPAVVSEDLRRAFYSGVPRDSLWLVCSMGTPLSCADAPTFRTSDVFGSDDWAFVQPVTVSSGEVVVGAHLDPVVSVAASLVRAEDPSAGGPSLQPVTILPGDTFFDLGSLAPGRYVVSILTDPTSPTIPGQTLIGVLVQ